MDFPSRLGYRSYVGVGVRTSVLAGEQSLGGYEGLCRGCDDDRLAGAYPRSVHSDPDSGVAFW